MSDKTSQTNDEVPQSGWKQPSKPGTWRTPEKSDTPQGWRVSTLPKDLSQEPEDTGGWHLPDPTDTVFTEEDEIEILSPEDQLLNLVNKVEDTLSSDAQAQASSQRALAPEDQLYSLMAGVESDAPDDIQRSPEDLLALLDRFEEEDLDQNASAGVRSELFALQSLVEDDLNDTSSSQGTQSFVADLDEALEDVQDEVDALSGVASAQTRDDPGDYARRMLADLGEDGDARADFSGTGEQFATTDDPGDYARQMLNQLGDDDDEIEGTFTPLPQDTAVFDPRQEELARRFLETEQEVNTLRQMVQNGQLSQDDLREQIRSLMILDDDQIWWTIGEESNLWYKYINEQWVLAEPPRIPSVTRQFATSQLLDDDPRIPGTQAGVGVGIRLDENFMPLPRDVPTNDLDRTLVGESYLSDLRGTGTETLEHMGDVSARGVDYAQPTMPGQAVQQEIMQQELGGGTMQYQAIYGSGQEASVASAIDSAEPPDVFGDSETPLADEAYEERQRNLVRTLIFGALTVIAIALLFGAGGVLLATQWYNGIVQKFETQIAALQNYSPPSQSITLLDYRGEPFATISNEGVEQISVSLTEMSPDLIHAIVSVENPTYFTDPGWEIGNTFGGFFQSLSGSVATPEQPTITQEIAQDLVLRFSAEPYSELERIAVAGELTKRYSKEFLLRLYLNQVYFGNQSYGVQAASRFYFDKDADELNLAEATLLAGLIADPVTYDPVNNRELSFARQDQVIEAVRGRCLDITLIGRHCVTAVNEGDPGYGRFVLNNAGVRTRRYQPRTSDTQYPHFVNLVRGQLEAAIPNIYSLGVEVRTTLVQDVQVRMETALTRQVDLLTDNGVATGAMIWTDVDTGAIRGYVGSHDYEDEENQGFTDYTRVYRRPGQVIMPVVYAAALQGIDRNGDGSYQAGEYYTPATVLWDVPMTEPSPGNPAVGQTVPVWKGYLIGPTSVRQSLASGYNGPAVQAYNFVGAENFLQTGNAMGGLFERTDLQYSWLTAIGDTPVRLVDLVEAYGTIASGGIQRHLYVIEGIQDRNGNAIPLPDVLRQPETRVLSPAVAFLLQNILSDNNARDQRIIPRNSRLVLPGQPEQNYIAAQKGASIGNRDVWTIGFTENAVVGVWLGRPDENAMQNVDPLNSAANVWNSVIGTINTAVRAEPFRDPGNVERVSICTLTGTRYDQCGSPQSPELFASSRPALEGNPFVTTLAINTWTRERASAACPNPEDTFSETFATVSNAQVIDYLRSGQGQPIARLLGLPAGFQQAPTETCNENSVLPSATITNPVNNQVVQGEVSVQGQVSAPANFNRYVLEYAPAGQQSFFQIGSPSTVQQPNPGSILGTWNTSTLGNGSYDLRLSVIANDGGYVRRTVRVTVENPTPTPTPTIMPTPTVEIFPSATDPGLPFENVPTPTPNPF